MERCEECGYQFSVTSRRQQKRIDDHKNITGKIAEAALDLAGITCNKNTIPYDPQKPFVTSGIRLGTPAVTTRGMKEAQMAQIADFIDEAVSNHDNPQKLEQIAAKVKDFLSAFPLYKGAF